MSMSNDGMPALLSQAAVEAACASDGPRYEPGSYRDRSGTVFYREGRVLRGLNESALKDWEALQRAPFFEKNRKSGKIIDTWVADFSQSERALGNWAGVLEHARIPFVSYPYEWPFGMLKDAALLQLDLMREALACGMILKDSSPYNIQWNGVHPVFIDIPSFTTLRTGEPWMGYRQFC